MDKPSLSAEGHARIQAVIAALRAIDDAPIDEESPVSDAQNQQALDAVLTAKLTMPEFVEMEERPEQFGCAENMGWHILIRNVLGLYWSEITQAMISPFEMHGDQQIIYRASRDFQLMVSDLMSTARSSGNMTADTTRDELDAALWLWLERSVQRLLTDVTWYTGVPTSNFHYLFTECQRDVQRARADEAARLARAAEQDA